MTPLMEGFCTVGLPVVSRGGLGQPWKQWFMNTGQRFGVALRLACSTQERLDEHHCPPPQADLDHVSADGCARAPDVGCTQRFSIRLVAGEVLLDEQELRTLGLEPVAPERPAN